MYLFYLIFLAAFANAFASKLVSKVLRLRRRSESKLIQEQKTVVTSMLSQLSQISMTDEWAKYAKLQRKINKEKETLEKLHTDESEYISTTKSMGLMAFRCFLGLIFAFIVFAYRTEVVAYMDEDLIWPIASKICWSDVPGAITVPMWIIVSSSAAKTLAQIF